MFSSPAYVLSVLLTHFLLSLPPVHFGFKMQDVFNTPRIGHFGAFMEDKATVSSKLIVQNLIQAVHLMTSAPDISGIE